MSRRTDGRMTRGRWLLLGVSASLCAAVIAVTRYVRPVLFTGDAELAALLAERNTIAGCDDRTRDELRRQAAAISHRRPISVTELQAKLGPAWRWQETDSRHFVLTRATPRLRDWATIVGMVEALQAQPGLALAAFDAATTGTRSHRTLTRVVLEITWQP